MTTRIYLVSGPRNISTALMYSFRSRADTTVYDEPLYGHYLAVTGIDHPGRADVLATEPTDGEEAIRTLILGDCPTPVLFLKSMGHHTVRVGLDLAFLDEVTSVFLIREPREMLTSLIKNIAEPTAANTGLPQQVELLDRIEAEGGHPIVVDSGDILHDPPTVLAELCRRIGIPWDASMLSWEAGPKPEDGVWAEHWYANVHKSTGFGPYRSKNEPVPDRLAQVLEECEGHYERLARHAMRG